MAVEPWGTDPEGGIEKVVNENSYSVRAMEKFLTDVAPLGIDWSHVAQAPLQGSPLGPVKSEGPRFEYWASEVSHRMTGWEITLNEATSLWRSDSTLEPHLKEAGDFVTRSANGLIARSRHWWWGIVEWINKSDEVCVERVQQFLESRAKWQPILNDWTPTGDVWTALEKIDRRLRTEWRDVVGPIPSCTYRWLPGGRPFSKTIEDQIIRTRKRLFEELMLVAEMETECLSFAVSTIGRLRRPIDATPQGTARVVVLESNLERARDQARRTFEELRDLDMAWSVALAFEEVHAFDCAFLEEGWERVLSALEEAGLPHLDNPSRMLERKIGRLSAEAAETDIDSRWKWLRAAGAIETFSRPPDGVVAPVVPTAFQRWYLNFAIAQARKLPANVYEVAPRGPDIGPANLETAQ